MKMKKSLLIVPAMATMLLAAAGSVGGTVAWFSANTTYTANASQFAVGSLDGNLACVLGNGKGTTADGTTVTVETGALLADASYDHANRTVWTDTSNTEGEADGYALKTTLSVATGAEGENNQLVAATFDSDKHVYWAVTWTMTFSYTMPTTGEKTNLYFNNNTSTASQARQTGQTGDDHTAEGFRIAWTPITTGTSNATGNARVWAPLTTNTAVSEGTYTNLKYVAGTSSGTATNYTTSNLMLKLATPGELPVATDAASGSKDTVNCLGQFAGTANSTASMAFVCVAWYEGEDAKVRSTSTKDIVSDVAMRFYVVKSSN